MKNVNEDISKYFTGDYLYGEDFDDDQVKMWFNGEREAYYYFEASDRQKYKYYHNAINIYHGYKWLDPEKNNLTILSIGGAYGDELLPIMDKISKIFILESSPKYESNSIKGVDLEYLEASHNGKIPLPDNSVDLITCFGVLHHLPQIRPIFKEMSRCLAHGGIILIREPIVSMGDWTKVRKNATVNERGIPVKILKDIIIQNNLNINRERYCIFYPFPSFTSILSSIGFIPYNSLLFVLFDDLICNSLPWKIRYHPQRIIQKIQPSCVFFIAQKFPL